MPHEVESMTYYGQEPWHKLGVKLENPATAREAIKAANLEWNVLLAPVFAHLDFGNQIRICPDKKATVREFDLSVLGVVGKQYKPIQNIEAFDFFDSVVGEGKAIYHTAGSLKGGKRIWILAHLPGDMYVTENDIVKKYLLLVNSHDGSMTLRMFFTPIRVVCNNTLTWALQKGHSEGIAIKHTGNIQEKIEQAKQVLGLSLEYYDKFQEVSKMMVKKPATEQIVEEFLRTCFPKSFSPDASTKAKNMIADIMWIYSGQTKTLVKGSEGTVWALANAVAEWVDHGRTTKGKDETRADNRLNSIWFGSGKLIKQRAFDTALALLKK